MVLTSLANHSFQRETPPPSIFMGRTTATVMVIQCAGGKEMLFSPPTIFIAFESSISTHGSVFFSDLIKKGPVRVKKLC